MDKPHGKPWPKDWPKSKTSGISKQSPSPLRHTFLLGRARFTAQPLSALLQIEAGKFEAVAITFKMEAYSRPQSHSA